MDWNAHIANQHGHSVKSFGMPRRQNHHRFRMADPNVLEGFQQRRFFIFNRAAAYEHRPGTFCRERKAKFRHDWRRRRGVYIEFEITCHLDTVCIRADCLQTRPILCRLGEKCIHMRQHLFQGPAIAQISRQRPVGDARVDHGNARTAGVHQTQKIRPEFGFGQHN